MLLGPLTKKVKNIHLIGIGGAGMNGIAEILLNLGFMVSGSDLNSTPVTKHLESLGANIFIGHSPDNVSSCDVAVYSSAVKEDNPEIRAARERKIPVIKRPEMLAELMRMKYGICIAGTHGKTTTTSIVGQILTKGDIDPTIIVGGRVTDFGGGAKIGQSHYLVLEADEYDRTFLKLTPVMAVVTNIDLEHLDCYHDIDDIKSAFVQFVNKVPFWGSVILCIDNLGVQSIIPEIERRIITYGVSPQAEIKAVNIVYEGIKTTFDVDANGKDMGSVTLNVPGTHNVRNALAAITIAMEMDIPFKTISDALAEFITVERRFQIIGEKAGIMVVDDYAHHPTEIIASLDGIRTGFNRRIIAIFQPHLFSRTRDFYEDFGRAFMETDILFVTDIYPSREAPIEGVTGKMVSEAANAAGHRCASFIADKKELIDAVADCAESGDIVVTFGAGDINKIGYEFLEVL
ncbi:UDP-N-acetylmuramate--L-alanine ligase [Candidatus Latescibacterota bacterium]